MVMSKFQSATIYPNRKKKLLFVRRQPPQGVFRWCTANFSINRIIGLSTLSNVNVFFVGVRIHEI